MEKITILWLDDERNPEVYLKQKSNSGAFLRTSDFYKKNIFNKYDVDFVWVKNYDEFVEYIEKNGLPEFVSFDRDLKKGNGIPKGSEYPNGEDCAKWLKDYCEKNGLDIPVYFVHSANKNGQKNIPEVLGVKPVVEKKTYVLKFNDFINEKYDKGIMDEKIQSYVDEINNGLTDEAMDCLLDNGNEDLMKVEELGKLFSKKFMHREDCPCGLGLCLVYDENNGEMELFSLDARSIEWSIKCDINNVQSIINCAIECLNHCMGEKLSWNNYE